PQALFAALRRLFPHDLSTPEEAPDGSAARPMGDAALPKRGRSAARRGSGISGGVRRVPGVGVADRGGKLAGRLAPTGRDAGPPPPARAPPRPRAGTLARDLAAPVAPAPGEALSFERHIKGLFRARDRGAMRFAFDLWSVADVRTRAHAIQARLKAGTMPCDG